MAEIRKTVRTDEWNSILPVEYRTIKRIKAISAMMKDKTVPKRKKALVIFGLIYLVLPVDIIPPVLFPFGFLDDLVLWLWIIWHLSDILDTYWMGEKTEDYSGKFRSKDLIENVQYSVEDDAGEDKTDDTGSDTSL